MRTFAVSLAVATFFAVSTAASAQVDLEPPTVPEIGLPDLPVAPVDDAVSDVTGTVTAGASDAVAGATSESTSGSSGGSQTSGTSGSSAGSSAGSAQRGDSTGRRTRFDRLPRRYELLLERILAGRNVDANLRRLREALAAASPALRARILRLVRAEIGDLRAGGVTPRERRRIARLERVEDLFTTRVAGTRSSTYRPAPTSGDGRAVAVASSSDDADSTASGGGHDRGTAATGAGSIANDDGVVLPSFPPPPGGVLGGAVLLVAVLFLALAAAAFGLAALPRQAVPEGLQPWVERSRFELATTGVALMAATMLGFALAALL